MSNCKTCVHCSYPWACDKDRQQTRMVKKTIESVFSSSPSNLEKPIKCPDYIENINPALPP